VEVTGTVVKPDFQGQEQGFDLEGRRGRLKFDGRWVRWRIQTKRRGGDWRAYIRDGREVFDAERVGGKVVLRYWRQGDRFAPIGLGASAKLQDLFVSAKIPAEERRRRLVAQAAGGQIFWVEGLRIGELARLTESTRRCLIWEPAPVMSGEG
jgi:tRNA(Ile)-lysidine synthetase-like protein